MANGRAILSNQPVKRGFIFKTQSKQGVVYSKRAVSLRLYTKDECKGKNLG